MTARILAALVVSIMLFQGFGWLIDPTAAASSLGMTEYLKIETGIGRNTVLGDFTSFFFTVGLLSFIGAYTKKYEWLYGPASLLAFAALFRVYGGLFHDTDFLISAIFAEVLMTSMLLVSIYLFKKQ